MKYIEPESALQLLKHMSQPMLLLDNSGTVCGFNHAFQALVGENSADAEDITLDPGLLQPLLGTSTLVNWIMPNGDECWLAIEIVNVPGMPDTQARFYSDITEKLRLREERDALQQELAEQALYDPDIHSLLSRRGLLVSLAPLVARCRRYNNPLSIIALSTMQSDGQPAMLAEITGMLRDQTRWADLVGLNNDKAFILVLQETARDAAMQMVEKLSSEVASLVDGDTTQLAARYGITECRKNDDADSFLERAEQALAEAADNDSGRAIAP